MLNKLQNYQYPAFKMDLHYETSTNITFLDTQEFFKSAGDKYKIVFIDPIVLATQSGLLDLEAEDNNLVLVPTNISEVTKSLDAVISLLHIMEDKGVGRRGELICAVGGGVLLDTVSFAASIYRRGISVTKIPSTLLGIIDASIGIKTGVNFNGQRNRLGSYHFDFNVIIDPGLLVGNSRGMMRQGLGEIFKIATIKGVDLFKDLQRHRNRLEEISFYRSDDGYLIISKAIELMLEELHDNPRETNLMRCVDFGHSFCPLVEMESISKPGARMIPHGYAVAYDCAVTTGISYNRGRIKKPMFTEIIELYKPFDFDFSNELFKDNNLMWASFLDLTKHRGGNQNLPIPIAIGSYDFLQDVTYDELVVANELIQKEFNL